MDTQLDFLCYEMKSCCVMNTNVVRYSSIDSQNYFIYSAEIIANRKLTTLREDAHGHRDEELTL